jgi:hypothetical protein
VPDLPVNDLNDPDAVVCYRRALTTLGDARVEFLVGGAYAFALYTGIARHTKDFDLFIRPGERDKALAALAGAGYQTEVTYPHWLAKARCGDYFIDLIYSSGNGVAAVDDAWFEHAPTGTVMGEQVRLCAAEELIWSKAFIMERNRYDGADIAHVLRAWGDHLDWQRLLDRFGPNWRVLYSHLILYGFVYPAERERVPAWVMHDLAGRLKAEVGTQPPEERLCQGTLLAAMQYLPDVERWGYRDARLAPRGTMSEDEIAVWTDGVQNGR